MILHHYPFGSLRLTLALLLTLLPSLSACAQEDPTTPDGGGPSEVETLLGPGPMTLGRLDAILLRIDPDAQRMGDRWQLSLLDREVLVVTDVGADRMRLMTPIVRSDALPPELYLRMLQANFDSALDARYAIASGNLFGVFVHPLRSLTVEFLLSGLSQVHNVAETFGTTFSSGALVFGGGDSGALNRDLLEKLQEAERQPGI